MRRTSLLVPAFLLAILLGFGPSAGPPTLHAQNKKKDGESERFDLAQPQSPAKPTPEGMNFVDQGKFDPRLKGYRMPEGFKLEIVAEEPTIINPVGMAFANDGTLIVMEWIIDSNTWPETPEKITYKDGSTRIVATMKKKVKDVVKVLKYNPEKKLYDKAEVILEDELPSSILLHDGWIYLSGRSTVRRFKQSKEGGPYDVKEVIAQGFCGFHHHQVSGMTIGNDGWLYITSGDDDNYVEGSDGSRSTVLRTGAVFRCRPDGSKMHAYSVGYRNPYRDLVYDTAANWFHVDNDNEDGSKFTGCRIMHVAEESDFGWRLFTGARCCRPDPVRGAVYGELPGKMPPMLKTGRGSPAGLLIYNDNKIPDYYRGWLYYPDVFRKLIRAYKTEKISSTFEITEEFEFLKSDDPLFRPCQMVTGPDGAIYICDWRTDSGGAGKLFGDGQHGRIYRATWAGGKIPGAEEAAPAVPTRELDSWGKITKLDDAALVRALESENMTDRVVAQKELVKRGDKNRAAVLKLLQGPETPFPARVMAIGVLNSFWNADVRAAFIEMLSDKDEDIRRLAADGLALNGEAGDKDAHAALLKNLSDPEMPVRRASALALGKINAPTASEVLVNVFKFDEGRDPFLVDGYLRAIERTGKTGVQKLLELARSGSDAERERVVFAFLGLRSREAAEALPEMLADPHVTPVQQVELIKSYTNYLFDPPISLDPLLDWVATQPSLPLNSQRAVIDVLAGTGNLKGSKATKMLTGLLESKSAEARLTAIQAIESARLTQVAPQLLAALGQDSLAENEKVAILKALRVVRPAREEAAKLLKSLLEGKAATGIKSEALQTLSAIDPASAYELAQTFLDQPDAGLQKEAVLVLGSKPEGAKLLGERFVAKKLPRDLLPQVSESLRKFAEKDPALKTLLTDVMKGGLLLSLEPAELAKIRDLVLSKGNAERGKAIYLNAKSLACINCHKMEGIGGSVGPDLTRLWDTASVEKIMESIIEPSKEIKEGFQSYRAVDKNGRTFTGLKVVDKPAEVVLRDADGKDVRIAREDIEDLAPSKVSLMPDNVIAQLSYDQFIDLAAFLKNRGAQESLRGVATEFLIAGPFGADLAESHPPEQTLNAVKWEKRSTEPNGYLDLKSVYNKENVSAYALTYVFSPKEQQATMLLGTDDTARVWIDGKLVHEMKTPRTAAPDQDRVTVTLQSGWNPVLVKVVNYSAGHGLFLRFQGTDLKIGTKKE